MVNIERNVIRKQLKVCEQNSSILKFGLILESYRYGDKLVDSVIPI